MPVPQDSRRPWAPLSTLTAFPAGSTTFPTASSTGVLPPSKLTPRFSLGQLYVVWEALKQQRGLYLIYGDTYATELAQKLLARPLLHHSSVIVLDGNNGFNWYLYTRLAKHFSRPPEQFLRLIKISRAFTCRQMLSLAEQTKRAVEKYHASLVVALGPLATFYDENVPTFEANKLFNKFQWTLRGLSHGGLQVLLACPEAAVKQRPHYLEAFKRLAVFQLACERRGPLELELRLERPEAFQQSWTLTIPATPPLRYWRQLSLFQ